MSYLYTGSRPLVGSFYVRLIGGQPQTAATLKKGTGTVNYLYLRADGTPTNYLLYPLQNLGFVTDGSSPVKGEFFNRSVREGFVFTQF
jgi:hypothetical protein